jgi:hypothetical protein|tara:strand:- start:1932 stop:2048 length:117 start_codon:yes stop_codon:yes gene_type:complete
MKKIDVLSIESVVGGYAFIGVVTLPVAGAILKAAESLQ